MAAAALWGMALATITAGMLMVGRVVYLTLRFPAPGALRWNQRNGRVRREATDSTLNMGIPRAPVRANGASEARDPVGKIGQSPAVPGRPTPPAIVTDRSQGTPGA